MTSPTLSSRVRSLKPSATIAVSTRAAQLRREGVDVLSFAAGEPDFDTPEVIKRAAVEALAAGQTKYMPTLGDPETRAAIAAKLRDENGIQGITGDHVAITAGAKHALYNALQCLIDPPSGPLPQPPPSAAGGEAAGRRPALPVEVLLPVPGWVSYPPLIELAGGKVVELPATPESGFKITPEQLRAAITERSRVLILNTPSNPCGTMYTPGELRALAGVVADAAAGVAPGLVILTDEIYEKIVYGGDEHLSIGSLPEVADRTVTVNGLSKAYAMTGWRVGYAACPGDWGKGLIKAMGTLQGQMTSNITSFVYPAVRVALAQCAGDVERMRTAFAERAEVAFGRLEKIPGLRTARPVAAYYAFPDVSGLFGKTTPGGRRIGSAMDLAEALLEEAKVAVVPGDDFGGCGPRHVRISFACSTEQVVEGMERISGFVGGLR